MAENYLSVPETKYTRSGVIPITTAGMINYVFQNTLSEIEIYAMLRLSNLEGVSLKIYTTDLDKARDYAKDLVLNVADLSMEEIKNNADFERALRELRIITDGRYEECKRVLREHEIATGEHKLFNYLTYADATDAHGDMNLILACFIGIDRLDTILSKWAEHDLLEILKKSRCTGVRLLLQSNKPGAIQKAFNNEDIMPNFLTWGIDADDNPEPSNWIFGSK